MNARPLRSEALREALGYSKFSSQPRVLVFGAEYHVVTDVIDALEARKWSFECMPVATRGSGTTNFVADLLLKLVTFRPDYILTINHFGFDEEGVLADLLATYGIPVASWFVDHPLPILGDASTKSSRNVQVFTFERTAIPWLKSAGFEDPDYLPTAANSRLFRGPPEPREEPSIKCSFVGNSWWDKARLEPSQRAQKAAKNWLGRTNLRQWLCADESRRPAAVKALGDNKLSGVAVLRAAVGEASLQTRQRFAETFAELGTRVYGDEHWRKLVPEVNLHPSVCYRTKLSGVFASTAVNLNVTADHMPTAVNQRVWGVPAVGGVLVTDAQEDVVSFFRPDVDIVTYCDWQEGLDKVRHLLARDDVRAKIQVNALARAREHTYENRLAQLHNTMRQRFE